MCHNALIPFGCPKPCKSDECVGLAVFTILKAGFVFSGKAGSGLVVARLPDGSWSAPSCIATAGVGWGLQIGAGELSPFLIGSPADRRPDMTEVVIVLNSENAVKAFSQGGNLTLGGELEHAHRQASCSYRV